MPSSSFVSGDRKTVMCAVDSGTLIAKGDLVYLATDDVRHLSSLSDSGTKAQNQAAANLVFIGVAMRSSPDGSTAPIPVATSGVFEFDCASATFEIGDLIGPAGTGSGGNDGVSATTVVAVAAPDLAIGRVAKRVAVAGVRVQIQVQSTILGSVQDGLVDGGKIWDGVVVLAQGAPTAETTTTPTFAAAEIKGGIITSTQTAAVTGTLDTGADMDTALAGNIFGTNYAIDWTLINLGSSSGAVTMTASTGHTYVGNATVAIATSARFRSRRTAADTWITYRLS